MATETMNLRGRPVTAEEAREAVHRLIGSHFHNKDRARCSIPVQAADDDVVASDYVIESSARIAELEAQLAVLTWTPIRESNLPKVGDEVLFASGSVKAVSDYEARQWLNYWKNCTHRRPINPPSPERGAK